MEMGASVLGFDVFEGLVVLHVGMSKCVGRLCFFTELRRMFVSHMK